MDNPNNAKVTKTEEKKTNTSKLELNQVTAAEISSNQINKIRAFEYN